MKTRNETAVDSISALIEMLEKHDAKVSKPMVKLFRSGCPYMAAARAYDAANKMLNTNRETVVELKKHLNEMQNVV